MAGLVSHATLRGVRIVPEFDSPAHCAQGWQFGEAEAGLGKLVLCERQSEDRSEHFFKNSECNVFMYEK